jgi:TolB-like protein
VACFDEGVSEKLIKEIAKEKPLRVVFRDSSFAKANIDFFKDNLLINEYGQQIRIDERLARKLYQGFVKNGKEVCQEPGCQQGSERLCQTARRLLYPHPCR